MSKKYFARKVTTCKYELTYTQGKLRGTFVADSINSKIQQGKLLSSNSTRITFTDIEELVNGIPLLNSARKNEIELRLEQAYQQANECGCQFNALLTMQQSKIDFGNKINRTGISLARLSICDIKKEYHYLDIPITYNSLEIGDTIKKLLQKANKSIFQYSGKIKTDSVFILMPQAAGFFMHEILGHLLERDLTFPHKPLYSIEDRGEQMLPPNISLCDNPFNVQGVNFGTYDDIGNRLTQKYLIKDGVLLDMITSLRSDSYYKQPMCRMYNLCLYGGLSTNEEILTKYPDGILIEDIIAGGVNPYNGEFLLYCNRAFYRENQEIKGGISNLCVRGSAHSMKEYIVEIGNDTHSFIGYCSKHMQTIPVGNETPTLVLHNIDFIQI